MQLETFYTSFMLYINSSNQLTPHLIRNCPFTLSLQAKLCIFCTPPHVDIKSFQ